MKLRQDFPSADIVFLIATAKLQSQRVYLCQNNATRIKLARTSWKRAKYISISLHYVTQHVNILQIKNKK